MLGVLDLSVGHPHCVYMKRVLAAALPVALGACFLTTEPESGLLLTMELNTTHVRSDSALVVVLTLGQVFLGLVVEQQVLLG